MFFTTKKKTVAQDNGFDRVLCMAEKYAEKKSEIDADYALNELAHACVTVVPNDVQKARLYGAVETLIAQHGDGDVLWDAYGAVCAVSPDVTRLWRAYAEKFNLDDANAIDKIDVLTRPELVQDTVLSKRGRTVIGPRDDVGLHPRAHYRIKAPSIFFVIDDMKGGRDTMAAYLDATYPLKQVWPETFAHNLSKRSVLTLFMDTAEALFRTAPPLKQKNKNPKPEQI
jgi:hypothetical protein